MSDEPRKPWRECKAIAEALTPKSQPLAVEQVKDRLRTVLLGQLAALGPEGANLAGRLANAPDGTSIEGVPGDLKVLEKLQEQGAAAGLNGHTAIALDQNLR